MAYILYCMVQQWLFRTGGPYVGVLLGSGSTIHGQWDAWT